ncbi:hypothetical protein VT930_11795 [Mycobacterium sherrisii]|uniref:hypothetical protein n=1 Tax=Mycobacterium sherrisii TaxID=243061 RepID=UPI002DDD8DCE|nr:hypothetical protein [Mycobacterium sherrisii]MEC4763786.1 hypothetical protein [Mycobacterium sherrisii]
MSQLDEFWEHYEQCCTELAGVQTVDEVIDICHKHFGKSSGDAFFPGGSGDVEILSVLCDAGWRPVFVEAYYFFAIRQPDGKDGLTYIEGDIAKGIQRR